MASRLLPLTVIAAVTYFFVATPPPAVLGDQATSDLINSVCSPLQGDDNGFCKGVFDEFLKGRSTDIHGLADLVQMVAVNNASLHYLYVVEQLGKTTDQATKNALSVCKDLYQLVYNQFAQGYFAFKKSAYEDTDRYEQKAERPRQACETTFKTPPTPPVDLMAERNRQMRILIVMSLQTLSRLLASVAAGHR